MSIAGPSRYLFVKHSEGWNVDRCTLWMQQKGVPVDWCYPDSGHQFPDPTGYRGVVVFGGANSANDCINSEWLRAELVFIERCLTADVPLFGICLGAQMLARVLGATVQQHPQELSEIGFSCVRPVSGAQDFLTEPLCVMQWHTEGFSLPHGAKLIATGELFENQAFQLNEQVLGVQFHPEVNPQTLAIWHDRNRQRRPGQLSDADRTKMMQDAISHDEAISRWLDGFLAGWTKRISQVA